MPLVLDLLTAQKQLATINALKKLIATFVVSFSSIGTSTYIIHVVYTSLPEGLGLHRTTFCAS